MGFRAGIAGASGYAGAELIRLIDSHPSIDLVWMGAKASAGQKVSRVAPGLARHRDEEFDSVVEDLPGLDILFISLPAGEGAGLLRSLAEAAPPYLIDLGPDFRHESAETYGEWYEGAHPYPESISEWVYGIPELDRKAVSGARRVANPGCYSTAALLALVPLFRAGLAGDGTVYVDGKSGLSGAGRSPSDHLHFPEAFEDVAPYALSGHRHLPEITEGLARYAAASPEVVFHPHLVPMSRGLMTSCYFPCLPGVGQNDVLAALRDAYEDEAFVFVSESAPHTKASRGANTAYISASVREGARAGVVFCAIDNLMKGAAGQAIQNANLMLDLPEGEGLEVDGVWP